MTTKLTMRSTATLIGHKLKITTTVIFLTSILTCCIFNRWEPVIETSLNVYIINDTDDTLVYCYSANGFFSYIEMQEHVIYPHNSTLITWCGVEKNKTFHESFFSDWEGRDSLWLYKYSSELRQFVDEKTTNYSYLPNKTDIVKVWDAPLRSMGDTINHFYNYSSWKLTYFDDIYAYGKAEYTIYENDLNN